MYIYIPQNDKLCLSLHLHRNVLYSIDKVIRKQNLHLTFTICIGNCLHTTHHIIVLTTENLRSNMVIPTLSIN